jgi:hypothetical protein
MIAFIWRIERDHHSLIVNVLSLRRLVRIAEAKREWPVFRAVGTAAGAAWPKLAFGDDNDRLGLVPALGQVR